MSNEAQFRLGYLITVSIAGVFVISYLPNVGDAFSQGWVAGLADLSAYVGLGLCLARTAVIDHKDTWYIHSNQTNQDPKDKSYFGDGVGLALASLGAASIVLVLPFRLLEAIFT